MAKKAAAKKQPEGIKPSEAKPTELRVIVDPQPDLPTHYVNHIEVGRMQYDFFILGTQLPIKPSATRIAAAKETGEIHIEASVQIVVPAALVDGIINALSTQKKLYDEQRKKAATVAPKLDS